MQSGARNQNGLFYKKAKMVDYIRSAKMADTFHARLPSTFLARPFWLPKYITAITSTT